jgi:PadR family transcriptional regulator, regulatory protein PadR
VTDTQSDLLRGSLDLLILKALSWGPRHGYGVAEWIEHASGDALSLEEGTLYPALHRLERKEWVTTTWGISDNNRRAKFYRLTAAGRAQFRQQAPAWHRYAEAVAAALRSSSPGGAHA